MAIPENVLAVAVLLHFRRELHNVLKEGFEDEALTKQERQALIGADERAERELAAPYTRALQDAARNADLDGMVEKVATRLRPGASPYRDLIAWWQRFKRLYIGRAIDEQRISLASQRDDEKVDAWLYELWIVLECIHLLHLEHAMGTNDTEVEPDTLQFAFTWKGRRFRFIYNHQAETEEGTAYGWQFAPASRPDYRIERETPIEVRYQGKLYWREPSVILDAKYYLGGNDPVFTHDPIKKLLGDMQLLGTQQGGLFFPRLPDPPESQQVTREVRRETWHHHGDTPVNTTIRLYKLAPAMPLETVQARLRDALDYASDNLPDRASPTCQGMWLDPDSINASRKPVPLHAVLCPKPHIGAGVFDLVDAEKHCLKDPRLCHVIGQPILPPMVIRATTRDDLISQASNIRERNDEMLSQAERSGDEERAEWLRDQVFFGIGRSVEQYVKLRGNTAMIEENFERWIFGVYWKQHERCLADETRRILVSGEYVWQEYMHSPLDDWAAPAIQYCRALERELKRRSCEHNLAALKKKDWTIGAYTSIYGKRNSDKHAKGDWDMLMELIQRAGGSCPEFENIVQRLDNEHVTKHRNDLAHGQPIARQDAEALRDAIIGTRDRPGILYCLAEYLQPV